MNTYKIAYDLTRFLNDDLTAIQQSKLKAEQVTDPIKFDWGGDDELHDDIAQCIVDAIELNGMEFDSEDSFQVEKIIEIWNVAYKARFDSFSTIFLSVASRR